MSKLLENTTAGEVSTAINAERHRLGATATGMVLTFIIVTDELHQSEATRAATFAANQHPCRIIVVIPRPSRGKAQLDAELWVGDRDGPGETVKLRLKGPLAHHEASVVLPLLLPDTPVVAWWPGPAPEVPADDPVGQLADRRITDAAFAGRPMQALDHRVTGYRPGDTDLAWTRTTPWRSVLATALDEPFDKIVAGTVSAERNNTSAPLLAGWLQWRLDVPVELKHSRGPGITSVTLKTKSGKIELNRPDGVLGVLHRTEGIERKISLPRRELRDLVTEELRRLDADEIYAGALAAYEQGLGTTKRANRARSAAESAAKKTAEQAAVAPVKRAAVDAARSVAEAEPATNVRQRSTNTGKRSTAKSTAANPPARKAPAKATKATKAAKATTSKAASRRAAATTKPATAKPATAKPAAKATATKRSNAAKATASAKKTTTKRKAK